MIKRHKKYKEKTHKKRKITDNASNLTSKESRHDNSRHDTLAGVMKPVDRPPTTEMMEGRKETSEQRAVWAEPDYKLIPIEFEQKPIAQTTHTREVSEVRDEPKDDSEIDTEPWKSDEEIVAASQTIADKSFDSTGPTVTHSDNAEEISGIIGTVMPDRNEDNAAVITREVSEQPGPAKGTPDDEQKSSSDIEKGLETSSSSDPEYRPGMDVEPVWSDRARRANKK